MQRVEQIFFKGSNGKKKKKKEKLFSVVWYLIAEEY